MNEMTLLAPGPVPMPQEVKDALSEDMVHHRIPAFNNILRSCLNDLKIVFQTQQPVLITTSTGSGAMEAAVVNTLSPGDEVICIESGKFGQRWSKMCETYGVKVHRIEVEWGQAFKVDTVLNKLNSINNCKAVLTQFCETSTATVHPVKDLARKMKGHSALLMVDAITAIGAMKLKMDEWGLDVVVAGSQKAFMMPTGLGFVALSENAWQAQKKSQIPKFYFDLEAELKANEKDQTHFSSAVALVKALHAALQQLNRDDKLKDSQNRCAALAKFTRTVCESWGLEVFSQSPSDSVTAIKVPEGLDGAKLRTDIESKQHVTLMGGQDHLKGKIIRIGHLGAITDDMIITGLIALGAELIASGYLLETNKLQLSIEENKRLLSS